MKKNKKKLYQIIFISLLIPLTTAGCVFNPQISSQQNKTKQTENNIIPQEQAQEQKEISDFEYPPELILQQSEETSLVVKTLDTEAQELQKTIDFSTWKTFANPVYNFQFKYPPDWKVETYEKNSINLLSPDLQKQQLVQPNSNLKGNIFIRIFEVIDEAPYLSTDIQEDLLNSEKNSAIYQVKFYTDTHARFIEKNELFNDYNIIHYFVLKDKKILEVVTIYGMKLHALGELITNTITY